MSKSATIKDVAKEANVSIATVSHVINNNAKVKISTALEVKAAMGKLGYVPAAPGRRPGQRSARHKVPKKTNRVALVTFGIPGSIMRAPVYMEVLNGLESFLSENDKMLVINNFPDTNSFRPELLKGKVDGLVLFAAHIDDPKLINRLRQFNCVQALGDAGTSEWWDYVSFDNSLVGKLAARHLLNRGHKDCAFVGSLEAGSISCCRGLEFQRELEAAGARFSSFSKEMVVKNERVHYVDRAAMSEAIDALLEVRPRPTGVFFVTDTLTAVAYSVLYEKGVVPGRDIEVVSCDNQELLLGPLHPRPASVDIHADEIGRKCAAQLLWRFEHPYDTLVKIVVTPELEPGDHSTNGH